MAKPPCGQLCRIAFTGRCSAPSHPGEERLIDFLAQMPTGPMILLTMVVLALVAMLIVLRGLI
jgi:hypothetical protein